MAHSGYYDTDALGLDPALRKEMFGNQGFGYGFGGQCDLATPARGR